MRQLPNQEQIIAAWNAVDDKPVVSICCITYNHETYIEDALEGFLIQQTNFPFEILIHDDASTDQTAAIIREYHAKYPRLIKPIYQTENQFSKGIHVNPELNFSRAAGKYIAICEGDDFWTDSHKLQTQVDFLEKNNDFALTVHAVEVIDNTVYGQSYDPYYASPKQVSGFEDVLFEHFIPTLSIMFRKSLLPERYPHFSRQVFSRDKALALVLTSKGLCYFDDKKMGCYRHHDGGITKAKKQNIELFRDREYLLYKEMYNLLEVMSRRLLLRRLARVDITVALMYRKDKNYLQMLVACWQAFVKDPLIFTWIASRLQRPISVK